MNVTTQLNVLECRLCKEDMTLYIATDFHPISWHISHGTTRCDEKLQNKGQNILFIVIISRGDKKLKTKMKTKKHLRYHGTNQEGMKIEN
jgi:hypothetical protein